MCIIGCIFTNVHVFARVRTHYILIVAMCVCVCVCGACTSRVSIIDDVQGIRCGHVSLGGCIVAKRLGRV